MAKLDTAFFDVGHLESLARQNTAIHQLDPRIKLVTTLFFIFTVVSYSKYDISRLLLFFLYPLVLIIFGNIPTGYILRKVLIVSPFAFCVGIFNPFFDREIIHSVGPFVLSGGWISFLSIMIRFVLTVSAAFLLIATTGFLEVCLALEKLRVPRAFVVQLLFLYRYLFVLIEETLRLVRGRALRSFNGKGMGMQVAGYLIGHLLLRTLNRARRIYLAMLCRGFNGTIHLSRSFVIKKHDMAFLGCWVAGFILMRLYNIPLLLGELIVGLMQ